MKIGKAILVVAFCCFSLRIIAQGASTTQASIENGKKVYEQNCLACHQADGSGVPNLTPPLIKTGFVTGDKISLIKIVLKGLKGVEVNGESYDNPMPPFESLNDNEIADVLTYVRRNFSNKASSVKTEDVTKARKSK
jgi:mono/diheme cytochrome c family protein